MNWLRLMIGVLVLSGSLACGDDAGDKRRDGEVVDAPAEGGIECVYFGTSYKDGDTFPAIDGCNTCKCNPLGTMPGQFGCTLIACTDGGTD